MDSQEAAFGAALREVEALVNQRRRWADALAAALELTAQYPGRAEAWRQLYIVRHLRNEALEAVEVIGRARICADFTEVMSGDFLRELLFSMVRRGEELGRVEPSIVHLRELHAGDSTRQACIDDLAGRLAYARGHYLKAVRFHARADEGLGGNGQWQANNLLHWLKAETMRNGRLGKGWIYHKIAFYANPKEWNGRPLLSRSHVRRARLVGHLGRLGCWIDDRVAKGS